MAAEFEPRANQEPTPVTESMDISPEALKIPRFYRVLAKRPLPPIIAKMVRQARFQADSVADAHPVIDPEETSKGKRIAGRRPIARSARELPKTKAIELELSHHLDPDNTVGADQNGFEDDGKANVFIAAEDVSEICEIVRMSHLELDDETEDPEVIEVLYEDQARYEPALTYREPNILEPRLNGRAIHFVEKPASQLDWE